MRKSNARRSLSLLVLPLMFPGITTGVVSATGTTHDETKTALASPAATANTADGKPAIQALKDSIDELDEDLNLLQHFLEVSTAEPERLLHTNLRRWVISNPVLRDSLFLALMAADSSLQSEAGAEAEVLSTPSADLIEVRFGNAVFKGMTLKDALNKSGNHRLYARVAESYKYSKDIELRDNAFKLRTPSEVELMTYDRILHDFDPLSRAGRPQPRSTRVDASLYGILVKSGPTWGGEIRIGGDELGYPFWSAGKVAFLVSSDRVKFGFEIPLAAGLHAPELFPPFVIRKRQLDGTRGFVAEADFGPVGGKVSFTRLSDSDLDNLTDPRLFYYVTGVAQAYYSFGVALNPTNIVRVKVGGGVHRVNQASVTGQTGGSGGTIVTGLSSEFLTPYLKFEFLNRDQSDKFGLSVQFYELTFLFTGNLEIVPNILSLEAKYTWPIAPDRPPWQSPEFFIVSPHIRLSF